MAHSSNFNSIETVWSVAKKNFRKLMQMEPWERDVSEDRFRELVKMSVDQIPPQQIKNMFFANRAYIVGYLNKAEAMRER